MDKAIFFLDKAKFYWFVLHLIWINQIFKNAFSMTKESPFHVEKSCRQLGSCWHCQGNRFLLVYWLPPIKDPQIAEQNTKNQRNLKVSENVPAVLCASLTCASFPSRHCSACFPRTTSDLDSMTSTKHTVRVHFSKKSLSNVCFFFQFGSKRWLSKFCLGWLCQRIVFYQKRGLLAEHAPRAAITEPYSRKRPCPRPAPSRSE